MSSSWKYAKFDGDIIHLSVINMNGLSVRYFPLYTAFRTPSKNLIVAPDSIIERWFLIFGRTMQFRPSRERPGFLSFSRTLPAWIQALPAWFHHTKYFLKGLLYRHCSRISITNVSWNTVSFVVTASRWMSHVLDFLESSLCEDQYVVKSAFARVFRTGLVSDQQTLASSPWS